MDSRFRGNDGVAESIMYRSLNPEKIIETVQTLRGRIQERFPESGLYKVCDELLGIAETASTNFSQVHRSPLIFRAALTCLVVLVLVILIVGLLQVTRIEGNLTIVDLIQTLEAATSEILVTCAGFAFIITIDIRIKRKRALAALHELRSIAHVVDMHQLTKDPEQILGRGATTSLLERRPMSSFELTRYLDYCSEMLSLIGKLAALYAQGLNDPVILEAVNDIENLTNGLARKIWQKITILQTYDLHLSEKPIVLP